MKHRLLEGFGFHGVSHYPKSYQKRRTESSILLPLRKSTT
jgi:hypothetical protein